VKKENEPDRPLSVIGHLHALRGHVLRSFFGFVFSFVVAFYFSDTLLIWLRRPFSGDLVFLSPAEPLWTILKISGFSGLFMAVPLFVYEGWRFVGPGLLPEERRAVLPFLFLIPLCFMLGIAFCYWIAFPFAIRFLIAYGGQYHLVPQISISMYIDFHLKLLLAFGVIFELPAMMLICSKLGFLTQDFFRRNRKIAMLIAFIMAAVLTPTPDIFNQCLMAIPLILLYEIGIIVIGLGSGKK